MKLKWIVLLLTVVAGVVGRSEAQAGAKGTDILLKLEADFQKATAERGFDGFMSFFGEDSADLPNGGEIVQGKENIRQALGPWGPDVSLTWTPVKAEMAESGDLGYTFGNYVFKDKDKDGKVAAHYGKYATVWRKQKDGTWKVAFDMGNTSPAPKGN